MRDGLEVAIDALKVHTKSGDVPIYLQITVKETLVTRRSHVPVVIPLPRILPHRNMSNITIACIVKDPAQSYRKDLEENELISEVISIGKLKSRLKHQKLAKEFCNAFDFILVQDTVAHLLPSICPRLYESGRTMPIPILFTKKTGSKLVDPKLIRYQVKKIVRSTSLSISPGTCLSIVIGNTCMPVAEIADNIKSVEKDLISVVPKLTRQVITGAHIKTANSASIPIPV